MSTEIQEILSSSLDQLEAIPVKISDDAKLQPLLPVPQWFESLKPWCLDNFPVLECAVDEWESFWAGDSTEVPEPYGPFEEVNEFGESLALEARPLQTNAGKVVLLRHLGEQFKDLASTLQKARDHLLIHEALEKEIQKKEFLLHTIVHDLAGPLTSIKGAFHILSRQNLAREQMEKLLEIGVRQTEKQHSMIGEILDVFSAEMSTLNQVPTDSVAEPLRVSKRLKEALDSAFEAKGVTLNVIGDDSPIMGEEAKLERVISNLIENALRHVPRGATVEVSVERKDQRTVCLLYTSPSPRD